MMGSPKQRSILTIAVSLLFIFLSGAATAFLYRETRTVKTEIQTIREEIFTLEAENGMIREFQTIRAKRAEEMTRIHAFFIDKDRPLAFIEALESLGRQTKTSLAIDAGGASKDPKYFTFRLSLEGSREDTLAFTALLERMPYEILIRSFTLSSSEGAAESPGAPRTRLLLTISAKTK